jgi:hypothetical protein
MTKEVAKTAKAKKIQVFVGKQLLAETDSSSELKEVIFSLQQDGCTEFKVFYHVQKISHLYTKGRYDKNYRITGTEYVAPSKAVSEEAAAE